MMKTVFLYLYCLTFLFSSSRLCHGFLLVDVPRSFMPRQQQRLEEQRHIARVDATTSTNHPDVVVDRPHHRDVAVVVDDQLLAYRIVDECSLTGEPNDQLVEAVHYLEKNSYKMTVENKQELWQMAHGSWKLVLSTGSNKHNAIFHKPPSFLPFSFAMIDDTHFGNGIGSDSNNIWISLLDRIQYDMNHRRLAVYINNVYLGGHNVTQWLPSSVRRRFRLGKTSPQGYDHRGDDDRSPPPPIFVLVGCTDQSLIARGNQSGGLAIWSRLQQDIRKVAYLDYEKND